jgi:hypothetical protein
MREALKVFCVVVIIFAAPAAALGWDDIAEGTRSVFLKYGCPVLVVLALAGFLKIHFRADEVPDYLHRVIRKYFIRGGFCFGFRTKVVDRVCYLVVYFQNQQDKPCVGRVALRPARGFFLNRPKIAPIAIEIECEAAAFGSIKIAVPIPEDLQGKRQAFEVGASVYYPNRKGRTLRFRDGIVLRANSDFGNAFATTLTVAGLLTGQIHWTSPATVTLNLPTEVEQDVVDESGPEVMTLWRLGDPPLEPEAYQHKRQL